MCIPCFIVPVLLFVWHRFIQPYILRFWNPWAKKDEHGKVIQSPEETKFPIDCSGGTCVFNRKSTNAVTESTSDATNKTEIPEANKKDD